MHARSWIQGEMTNFEYLMELNKLAGRTFNDLMQYPIFPYILADYTSASLNLADSATFRQACRLTWHHTSGSACCHAAIHLNVVQEV